MGSPPSPVFGRRPIGALHLISLLSGLGLASGPALGGADAPAAESAEARPPAGNAPEAAPGAGDPEAPETPPQVLQPFVVRGAPYVEPLPPVPALGPMAMGVGVGGGGMNNMVFSFGWPMEGDMLLSFTRAPVRRDDAPFASAALDAGYLGRFPFETTASLLERQLSYPINAYAASGPVALVLRDGVPLNHAFDGTVNWRKVPRASLGKIELLPAGSAAAWGDARGVAHLFSTSPQVKRIVPTRATATAADRKTTGTGAMLLTAGTAERSFEQWLAVPAGEGTLQLGIAATEADERRAGQPGESEARSAQLSARWQTYLTPNAQLSLSGRYFAEKREQPGGPRRERELSAAAALSAKVGPLMWQATLFAQRQPIEGDTDAFIGLPHSSLDVMPATFGGDIVALAGRGEANSTALGASYHTTRATVEETATGERSRFERTTAAGHAIRTRALDGPWRVSYGARWEFTEDETRHAIAGERHDRVIRISPMAGLTWHGGKAWVARLGTQRGYQRPTLHELYELERGTRLVPEISRWRTEFGIEWRSFDPPPKPEELKLGRLMVQLPPSPPRQRLSAGLRLFNDRTRSVASARGPRGEERDLRGGEARIAWTPASAWRVDLACLAEETGSVAGVISSETPTRRQALATLEFPAGKLRGLLVAGWRDEPVAPNHREASRLLHLGASYPWSERTLVFGSLETTDGSRAIPTLARAPRESARVGIRRNW